MTAIALTVALLVTGTPEVDAAKKRPLTVGITPEPDRPRLAAPDYLPELARSVLRERMQRHGDQMMRLLLAVTFLQHEVAAATAKDIAGEPRLVRPLPGGADDLNRLLPERFFVLQDQLRKEASDLEAAAKARNDAKMAAAFGRVSQTCVACHSAYLNP